VKCTIAPHAGDVDDAVDLAERVDGLLHHALRGLEVGDAVTVDHGLAAGSGDFVADFLGWGRVAATIAVHGSAEVVDYHFCTFGGGEFRHLRADATASAGHQHHFAV
jgi:hypothetical protein